MTSRRTFLKLSGMGLAGYALPLSPFYRSSTMNNEYTPFEVIIIGGSYAGLSAAMTLGRARRKVLVIDHGKPCNRRTPHAHNLIGHDGDAPADIVRKAKEQVLAYPTVSFVPGKATSLSGENGAFTVGTENGEIYMAEKLLLASGVRDTPMPIDGFAECWGISVLHCPYCHGYEVADAQLGVVANGETAFEMTRLIHHWSKDLTLFTNGASTLSDEHRQKITARGIRIIEKEIAAIGHEAGYLHHFAFKDGSKHPLKAVFARGGIAQHDYISQTGCALQTDGMFTGLIKVDDFGKTTIPGIHAAGDNCSPMRALGAAMSAGAKAGGIINHELIVESF